MTQSIKQDAIKFVEIVKDRVCDWIIMHGQRPVKPEDVCITNMTFEPDFEIKAMAQYLVKPWKIYSFYIYFDFVKQEILTTVMNPYVRKNGILTKDWNGLDYLCFDEDGHSKTITRKEKRILDADKRLKQHRPKDLIFSCSECKRKFATSDFETWLDSGLRCPICGASGESLCLIERLNNEN